MSEELGVTLDVVVPASLAGQRVDRAVALLTDSSRREAHDAIAAGAVSIDGVVVAKAATTLAEGQRLEATLAAAPDDAVAPDGDVVIHVVVEDYDFVVVDKEPDQVVHPGSGRRDATVVAGLLARYPQLVELAATGECEPARPGVVHRLDRGTSGLVVVALTSAGYASLSAQASAHSMERTYLALVEGDLADERGLIDAPIGRSARTPTLMAVRAGGRPARTRYEVVARLDAPRATLVRATLETGRTHQIRVHFATIGHPVVNDARYGHRRDRRLGEDRFFLHASSLAFAHPRTGASVRVTSPLPADLAALVPGVGGLSES